MRLYKLFAIVFMLVRFQEAKDASKLNSDASVLVRGGTVRFFTLSVNDPSTPFVMSTKWESFDKIMTISTITVIETNTIATTVYG